MLAKKPENICNVVNIQQASESSYHRLVDAYNTMIAAISTAFADSRKRKMTLSRALRIARDEIVLVSDITPHEAVEIGECIKRDINDAAEFMMEASTEFSDWLLLDIDVLERKMVERFQSRTELERLFGANADADNPNDNGSDYDIGPSLY